MTNPASSYSPLAWEIARRAQFEGTDGGGIKASAVVGAPDARVRIDAFGPDVETARIRLADELDQWAEQGSERYGYHDE